MDRELFNIFNGFQTGNSTNISETNKLKNRMKTFILKAKQYTKDEFIRLLAEDYIRISKEL